MTVLSGHNWELHVGAVGCRREAGQAVDHGGQGGGDGGRGVEAGGVHGDVDPLGAVEHHDDADDDGDEGRGDDVTHGKISLSLLRPSIRGYLAPRLDRWWTRHDEGFGAPLG